MFSTGEIMNKQKNIKWTKKMLSLLGTDFDHVIADKLGLSMEATRKKRQRLGIPKFNILTPHISNEEIVSKLGKMADKKVAKQYGISTNIVRKLREDLKIEPFHKRYLPEECFNDILKKTMTDGEIGEKYGVSHDIIRMRRVEMGIIHYKRKK